MFDVLVEWKIYLAPEFNDLIPGTAHEAMLAVGVIEIVAGVLVFLRPRIAPYVVAVWLAGIIFNLLLQADYYDIALRDLGLLLAAVALARLALTFPPPSSAGDREQSPTDGGPVVLVGEEDRRPYERPPLSKSFLQGSTPAEEAFVHPGRVVRGIGVEVRSGTRTVDLHRGDRELVLDRGGRLRYDRLLLATGSAARPLTVPGADLAGVHLLRTLDDAERLRAALEAAPRVVVGGSGWIGTEVAASARTLGCDVTLVGRDAIPAAKVLGAEVGAVFRDLHRDHGVDLVMSAEVGSFRGADRVEEVRLRDGRGLPCDLVVVGVGAAPRLAWSWPLQAA
ncbi:MAG: NAD(P)/FAD-dependent oxidoreductase [Actinomycetota bacterium]